MSCSYHRHPFPERFTTSNRVSAPTEQQVPMPLAPGHHYSTLCLHGFAYLRHLIQVESYVRPSSPYFIKHNVFTAHPCCIMYQNSIHFYAWIILHCKYLPHFVYSESVFIELIQQVIIKYLPCEKFDYFLIITLFKGPSIRVRRATPWWAPWLCKS